MSSVVGAGGRFVEPVPHSEERIDHDADAQKHQDDDDGCAHTIDASALRELLRTKPDSRWTPSVYGSNNSSTADFARLYADVEMPAVDHVRVCHSRPGDGLSQGWSHAHP